MKVVIELIGNESRGDLLATSNYLRELAEGSLPVSTEAKVYGPNDEATANEKTDLDKLVDAIVEATKVKDEEVCLPLLMEAERAKTRAKRAAKPAPAEEPAPVEEVKEEAPAPVEEVKEEAPAPAPAPVEEPAKAEKSVPRFTIDDCKSWAMKALNAKKRPIVQEAFESVGASSFPTLKTEMFNDFVAYISSRL